MVWVGSGSTRLAPCLAALFVEADRRFPGRSKASDGTIGDQAHAARTSDHNPADDPGDGVAVAWVCAADLTDDSDGPVAWDLCEHLRRTRDPRVKYCISEGHAWYAYVKGDRPAYQWVPYTGVNAHKQHGHVSVWNTAAARDDLSPWFPKPVVSRPAVVEEDEMPPAPSVVVVNGVRFVFVLAEGGVWYREGDRDWQRIPGGILTSAPGAWATGDGGIEVVARGTDGATWTTRRSPVGVWGAWVSLGGRS